MYLLERADTLLAFLEEKFFLRHRHDKPPKAYSDHTLSNMLKEKSDSVGLEQKAGVEHVHGKLLHRIKL
ncbi:g8564 [Coccomyxa elongata]